MVTVKRRSDEGADQVRVTTVHGAKGLEAPIVILPDTPPSTQDSCNAPSVLRLDGGLPAGASGATPPAGARRCRGAAAGRCGSRAAGCSTSR